MKQIEVAGARDRLARAEASSLRRPGSSRALRGRNICAPISGNDRCGRQFANSGSSAALPPATMLAVTDLAGARTFMRTVDEPGRVYAAGDREGNESQVHTASVRIAQRQHPAERRAAMLDLGLLAAESSTQGDANA